MAGLVAVVGSRSLPAAWADKVRQVVAALSRRGCQVASGGALGADLFALQAVVSSCRCQGARVFLPGSVQQAPWACQAALQSFVSGGGTVVPGSAPVAAPRDQFITALFARSAALAQAATGGVVGFVSGRSSGTWFTCQAVARLGRPVVVFPVEGPRALRSLGCGSWVPLPAWPGSFRWVPSAAVGCRCKHGIQVQYCSGLPPQQCSA
jgi:predicted Rossmann fold nucleotide-binding protein DprA/Smf involved in DNA uptake